MAARETYRSWSGTENPAWGLTTKVGPWKETPADLQKFNSRAGGPHAGHGNWFQSFNPKPYIQTMPTPGIPNYTTKDVVMPEDFDVPRGMKIPGINKAGSKGASGIAKIVDNIFSKYGINGSRPYNGAQGNGLENVKETKKQDNAFPARRMSRPMDVDLPVDLPDVGPSPKMDLDITSNIGSARSSLSNSSARVGNFKRHNRPPNIDTGHNDFRAQRRGYGLHSSPNYDHITGNINF